MNTNFKIDTNALSKEIEVIKAKRDRLNEIYNTLEKHNVELKDNWSSKTSEVVLNNFVDFYKGFKGQINDLNNDINFLEALIEKYKEFESKNDKTINEQIAV